MSRNDIHVIIMEIRSSEEELCRQIFMGKVALDRVTCVLCGVTAGFKEPHIKEELLGAGCMEPFCEMPREELAFPKGVQWGF